jgi:hypothetical protein
MAKEKSILDKFTETMKGLADSASQALKTEEPARVDETAAAYMPFAAEGLVSDPLPVPPFAAQPPRRKRGARKAVAKKRKATNRITNKTAAKKSVPKKRAQKSARKSASARSGQAAKTAKRRGGARKTARKRGR